MFDIEIKKYLTDHNFVVDAQDCLIKVFNTSYQIIEQDYNFQTGMMTIKTPDNTFIFKWNLGKP